MYCPYCGAQIQEDAVFCPKCGKTVKGGAAPVTPPAIAPTPISNHSNGKMTQTEFIRDYRKSNGFYAKCIGLGVSIVGTIVMVILLIVDIYRMNTDLLYQTVLYEQSRYGDGGAGHAIMLTVMIILLLAFLIAALVLQSKVRWSLYDESIEWKRYQDPRNGKSNGSRNLWKCPRCGKYNASYVGTCGCGRKRP